MKKIKINIDDLISVLEALRDSGEATEVVLFEHNGLPALADASDPENIIMFGIEGEDNLDDEDRMH